MLLHLYLIQLMLIAIDASSSGSSLIGWLQRSNRVPSDTISAAPDVTEKEDNPDYLFLPSPILKDSLNSTIPSSTAPARPTSSLLLFLPGVFVDPNRYKMMFQHIQFYVAKKYNFALHVSIGHLSYHVSSDPNYDDIAQNLLKKSTQELSGLVNDNDTNNNEVGTDQPEQPVFQSYSSIIDSIFLAGHSYGGILAKGGALPSIFDGLLLFGSVFNSKGVLPYDQDSLASFPRPVLSVSGDRDGFMRYLSLAKEMDHIEESLNRLIQSSSISLNRLKSSKAYKQAQYEMFLQKPIIIVPGMNHMQVGDNTVGALTKSTGRSDFGSYLELEEVWDTLSEIVAQFILTHTCPNQKNGDTRRQSQYRQKQLRNLEEQLVKDSKSSMDSVATYRYLSSPSYISKFAQHVQRSITNIPKNKNLQIMTHFHDDPQDFLYSKPTTFVRNGMKGSSGVFIHLVEQDGIKLHPELNTQQISPTIAIKCKSKEGLLEINSHHTKKEPMSLSQINEQTMQTVLRKHITKQQRLRYEKYGRKLRFASDTYIPVPPQWVETPLKLIHDHENYSTLSSPFTTTSSVNEEMKKFSWMYYGKPLTPSQAYEWVVFDAFKKIPTSNDDNHGQ